MSAKATYSAGTAYISIVPSFLNIEDEFKKQVRDLAQSADKDLAQMVARGMKDANREAKAAGTKAGHDFGGAYEANVKKHLNAAWKSLPEPDPKVKLTNWEKKLAGVRKDMEGLSKQRIGIDIDKETFDKSVADARKKLTDLRTFAAGPNRDRNWFNANEALGHLDDLDKFSRETERRAGLAGDQAGSAFNRRMAKVLQGGVHAIPPMKITADSTDAEHRIADVRKRMIELQSKRIGIDIDAGEAYAELKALQEILQKLDRKDVEVDVRTNAHEAGAGMIDFTRQVDEAGRSTERIGKNSNFSMSRLQILIALGASLGTAIVPAAAAAASAIGLIGTAAAAGVAGLGVFALGVSGIGDAVKSLDAYQKGQAKSANSLNQANRRMSGSTDQVRLAELGLGNARRKVAEQNADAVAKVADAERDLVGARRQGQLDVADAAQQVRDAQRDVTDAERDAVDTRRALNDAIVQATRDQEELSLALEHNSVDQRQAITAQIEALNKLNAVKVNPRSSETELRKAQESYDETTVRIKELGQKQKELSEDKAKADRLGVEGDKRVIDARRRVADSEEKVVKAREKVAREQAKRRDTEWKTQQRIDDARRKVGDAQRDVARKQKDGQYQLAQAANAVTAATRSQTQAYEKMDLAGGAALDNLNWQMDQLSPAGQRFARFLYSLKGTLSDFQASAAEPLLPDLQTAITMMLPYLPSVEAFIGKIADKLGDLAIGAVQAFGNPVWQKFFGYIDKTAAPSLQMMFEVGENLTQGLLSLIMAFSSFNEPMGQGLVDMSRNFAEWAANLDKEKGFQEFLQYVRENGPKVIEFLGDFGKMLVNIVEAAGPIGAAMLRVLDSVADFFNWMNPTALKGLVWAIGLVSIAFLTLGGVMRAVKLKRELKDIFGPTTSGWVKKYAIDTERATDKTGKFGKATATVAGMSAAAKVRMDRLTTTVKGFGGVASTARDRVAEMGGKLAFVRDRAVEMGGKLAFVRDRAVEMGGKVSDMGGKLAAAFGNANQGLIGRLAHQSGLLREEGGKLNTVLAASGGVAISASRGLGVLYRTTTGGLSKVKDTMSGVAQSARDATTGAGPLGRTLDKIRTVAFEAATTMSGRGGLAAGLQLAKDEAVGLAAAAEVAARHGMSQVKAKAMEITSVFRGPGGAEAAIQGVHDRLAGLAAAGEVAANHGLSILQGKVSEIAGVAREKFASAVETAKGKVAGFGRSVGTAAAAVGTKLVNGLNSAVAAFGGPWGIALEAAALLLADFGARSAEQASKVDGLTAALGALNDEFVRLRDEGKLGSDAADEAFQQMIKSNPDLQEAVNQLDKLGVGWDTMLNSVTSGNPTEVVGAFNTEIERLTKLNIEARSKWGDFGFLIQGPHRDEISNLQSMRDAWVKHNAEVHQATQALGVFNKQTDRTVSMGRIVKNNVGATTDELAAMATAWDTNQIQLDALTQSLGNFGDDAASAARRADDLTAAIERQYGAAMKANEAAESWEATLSSLSESVASNGKSLDIHSTAGRANRDALEAAAEASRKMWIEDVRAGGELPKVTAAHEDRIEKLRGEAKHLGLTKTETDKLIKTYGEIDPSITTKYTQEGFDAIFLQAQKLRFAQFLLEQGITDPKEADRLWKESINAANQARNVGGLSDAAAAGARAAQAEAEAKTKKKKKKATGGPIEGVGTGTSDSNLIWASVGEHMLTDAEVKAAGGHDAIYAWRKALLARGGIPAPWDIPRHAGGGAVGERAPRYAKGGAVAPFKVSLKMTKLPTLEDILSGKFAGGVGPLGHGGGGEGYQWQMAVLHAAFPKLSMMSGPRPGARTLSGELSYHARPNKAGVIGRAVDVDPIRAVANWIASHYGADTQELITPWPELGIWHGKPHRFSDAVQAQHDGRTSVRHIHWGFDEGGWLPPGIGNYANMTGQPEAVLNPNQWSTIEQFVQQGMARGGDGATYQFEFADTTLTPAHLRSIQQREDAMARAGRPR